MTMIGWRLLSPVAAGDARISRDTPDLRRGGWAPCSSTGVLPDGQSPPGKGLCRSRGAGRHVRGLSLTDRALWVSEDMTPTRRPTSAVESALTRLFTKSATVREVRVLDDHFRLVTLGGEALEGVRWSPGQKLQVALGGWAFRTYTPLSWDAAEGSTQLLLFLHGESPGSDWGQIGRAHV